MLAPLALVANISPKFTVFAFWWISGAAAEAAGLALVILQRENIVYGVAVVRIVGPACVRAEGQIEPGTRAYGRRTARASARERWRTAPRDKFATKEIV